MPQAPPSTPDSDLPPEYAALLGPATPAAQAPTDTDLPPEYAALLQPAKAQPSQGAGWGRALGLAARAGVEGLAAFPVLAGNAGIQLGNILNNSGLLPPSERGNEIQPIDLQGLLNKAGFPQPTGTQEKVEDFIESGLLGSRLPTGVPQTPPLAGPQALKQAVFQAGRNEGLVAPPSAVNPTFTNRILGGIAGKLKLQQEAMQRNQPITNTVAAREVGENSGAPLTQDALSDVRNQAASAGYGPVRAFGQMKTDQKFNDALDQLTASAEGANRSFPGITPANSELQNVVTALKQPTFHSADAVDALSQLRSLANDAYGAGKASLGKAYKGAAGALEDLVERNLDNAGQDGKATLQAFRDARTQMAKTYSVGKALEPSGDVNAANLASQVKRNKPLSGGLATVGNFAAAFPKAMAVPKESYENVSPLDIYGATIAALEAHNPMPLAIPLTRAGLRSYLLSNRGQAAALPKAFKPQTNVGLLGGLGTVAGSGLLSP